MKSFDGKQIRDSILAELKAKIETMERKPTLAVFWIGSDPVCGKYIELKRKVANQIGVKVEVFHSEENVTQEEISTKITELNQNPDIDGIMIQMPVPEKYDKYDLVHSISPAKDVDGLRFCCAFRSEFRPPVVLAILKAIEDAGKEIDKCEVVIVGRGFLVGWPLAQCLEEAVPGLVVADSGTRNLQEITKTADVLISAVGKAGIIQPDMIKEGVVLIDAGTTEVSGELKGDIDPACYEKSSFYTPVPGGIGPVTVAKLFENLVSGGMNNS